MRRGVSPAAPALAPAVAAGRAHLSDRRSTRRTPRPSGRAATSPEPCSASAPTTITSTSCSAPPPRQTISTGKGGGAATCPTRSPRRRRLHLYGRRHRPRRLCDGLKVRHGRSSGGAVAPRRLCSSGLSLCGPIWQWARHRRAALAAASAAASPIVFRRPLAPPRRVAGPDSPLPSAVGIINNRSGNARVRRRLSTRESFGAFSLISRRKSWNRLERTTIAVDATVAMTSIPHICRTAIISSIRCPFRHRRASQVAVTSERSSTPSVASWAVPR